MVDGCGYSDSVLLQCQSQGVEVYKVQSSEEQEQILKKRRKKAAKKQAGQESEVRG